MDRSAGQSVSTAEARHSAAIERILELACDQLGMDAACVGTLTRDEELILWTAGDTRSFGILDGRGASITTIARRVLDGSLPNLLPDASDAAGRVPAVAAAGIGALIGVPVEVGEGLPYGYLLVASHRPGPHLAEADAAAVRVLARAIAKLVEGRPQIGPGRIDRERIDGAADRLGMVFQPIVSLRDRHALGYEALARFDSVPERSPDRWFAEAARAGRGVDLELAAVRSALAYVGRLGHGDFLSINASPETATSTAFRDEILASQPERIVVELTNHLGIEDPRQFSVSFSVLRAAGVRLAVDDAGGGFASLSQLTQLSPNVIKIDPLLVRDVDGDPVRRSLVTAAVAFAEETGAFTVAEGIESFEEATTLLDLGVTFGQGHFLAPPGPLPFPA